MNVSFILNGEKKTVDTAPGTVVQPLLQHMGIASVRDSDNGYGFAGSDTILLNGTPVCSCLLIAAQIVGQDLKTVEHFNKTQSNGTQDRFGAVQKGLLESGCIQSGYNAAAAVLLIEDLLSRKENPSREDIMDALSGLFIRDCGYRQYFDAVALAVKYRKNPGFKEKAKDQFAKKLSVIGKPSVKKDSERMVKGEKLYVEDRIDNQTCVLKILRSPFAHAWIEDIDTKEAEKLDGVIAVFTHKDVPQKTYSQAGQGFPEPSPYDRMLLSKKARHAGDRVAAVVAADEQTALEALALIKVKYRELPVMIDLDQAQAEDAALVHGGKIVYIDGAPDGLESDNKQADPNEEPVLYQFPIGGNPRKNIAASVEGGIGDMEKGFTEADVIFERSYTTSQIQCTPLETHTCLARPEGDRLVVHASTQVPYHVRRIVSTLLELPENKVRVIKERVGGGYGSKQDIVVEDITAFCAYKTGRPVFHQYTREEEFIGNSSRKLMRIRVKLGAKKDGTFTAMEMSVESNQGAYGAHSLTVPMNGVSKSLPLFLCDNAHFDVTAYYSNRPPTGAYQGYGAPKANYALQVAVRELADKLGMDHLELVEKNMVREGSMLEILKSLGEGREGKAAPAESCGLDQALKQGAEMIKWGKAEKSDDPDVFIGKGFATVQQGSGLPGLDAANATIMMLGDGTFLLQSGGADLGTGLDLVCTKMAAEVLKTDPELIAVQSGDTDIAPFDTGAYASSGTYFSGGAARNAALKMEKLILAEAAAILNIDSEHLELAYPSTVRFKPDAPVKGDPLPFSKIAWHTQNGEGTGQIIASAHFVTEKFSFPYGAHFCQVAVNAKTGRVKVQKYYALQDAGTPVNPEYALGQMYGGVLKSMGHALYEEMKFDEKGICRTADLRSYGVPMIGDVPEDFEAVLIETDDPHGPFGAKSIAEISVNGAAPAIANAIYDAVGIWMDEWPFSPEKILRKLGKVK